MEKHISEGTAEYYIMNIFLDIDCFWVQESNGIHSQILSMRIEKYPICSLGMVGSQIEEKSNDPKELARRKKARYLSEQIN